MYLLVSGECDCWIDYVGGIFIVCLNVIKIKVLLRFIANLNNDRNT